MPLPLFAVEGKALVVRRAVLFHETAEGIQPIAQRGHADMVRPARQLRQFLPGVDAWVVCVVVGPVDPLLGIAAHQMHPAAVRHRPGHLGARNRQRRPRAPAARFGSAWRRTVGDGLLGVQFGQIDAARLVQPLELTLVMAMGLGAHPPGQGQCGRSGGEDRAAGQHAGGLSTGILDGGILRWRGGVKRHPVCGHPAGDAYRPRVSSRSARSFSACSAPRSAGGDLGWIT